MMAETKNKYEGLWKGRSAWYVSNVFKKKDIKELLKDGERKRIVLRHNKYKKMGDNRPDFIFAFVDAGEAFNVVDKLPYLEYVRLKDILEMYDENTRLGDIIEEFGGFEDVEVE